MSATSQTVHDPLLLSNDDEADEKDLEGLLPSSQSNRTRPPISYYLPYFSFVLNVVIFLAALSLSYDGAVHRIPWRGARPIYSPVQDTITHKDVAFLGLTERSKYHGPPSDAVDQAWDDLYAHAISAIPGNQAARLSNLTVQIPPSIVEDKYIVSIDVFHILHCLNTIRKYTWPERYHLVQQQRYKNISGVRFDHIDHCINNIREHIMCSADITPNVWLWNDHPVTGSPRAQVQFNSIHTCKDWDSIQAWAEGARSPLKFTDEHHTHGDLELDPEYKEPN